MKSCFKLVPLLLAFPLAYSGEKNTLVNKIVTPNVYKSDEALLACDVDSLAVNLTRVCDKAYGSVGIDWQSKALSRAICTGQKPVAGQKTTYSVLGDVKPCPGNHGGVLSSRWVCEVKVDADYQVKAVYVYPVTCSG